MKWPLVGRTEKKKKVDAQAVLVGGWAHWGRARSAAVP